MGDKVIDLRSDTVTRPTLAMREAMLAAPLGDDVFGEDPTVKQLEAKAASLFGMEAGLFCPSGTMTNQIAIKVHTQPGDEVICDRTSHVYNYEGGGIAFHSGASVRLLEGERGLFTADAVKEAIQPDNIHHPVSSLVVAENTNNRGGGSCWEPAELEKISSLCRNEKLKFHLDGARIFNAIVEEKGDAAFFGKSFDSISLCLSKGLGAPVGSVLLGSKDFIRKAIRVRKLMGGGMRQAGILAAAGIYALDHHVDRLKEDHLHAARIGDVLSNLKWVDKVLPVETNIVVFETGNPTAVISALESRNVLVVPFGPGRIRMVLHLDIQEEQVERVCEILKEINPV